MDISVEEIINHYNLHPHPEGGYFAETYRAEGIITGSSLCEGMEGKRNYSTAIYFLLPEGKKSHLHRIKSDEIWHFYLGGPLKLIQISPEGKLDEIILGKNIKNGHVLQHVVPAGHWFGATPLEDSEYSFVGCTVAPGFDFSDFELANATDMVNLFPIHELIIDRFC